MPMRPEKQRGATLFEVVVFTAIIVGIVGGTILYVQMAAEQRVSQAKAVHDRYELGEPGYSTGGPGGSATTTTTTTTTGPAGPYGPAGPLGPGGPYGPAGPVPTNNWHST